MATSCTDLINIIDWSGEVGSDGSDGQTGQKGAKGEVCNSVRQ